MIRILVDSSSDYCQEEIREKGLVFVPIQIELAGKEYLDGIDLDKNSFFEMLEESGEFPLTSQPSPQVFLDIFQEVKEQGDDLNCILISSHLSGTYQTAQLARQMADCEDHIFLIDSRAATYNIKVMADYALELVREGLSAAEIAEKLEKFKSRVKVVAMIDTLEYLRRGGRIGKAAAAVGDMARLKPVITVTKEGEIGVVAKALGKNKAVNAILKWVGEHPLDESFPAYSLYSYGTENSEIFEERLFKEGIRFAERLQIGATIGTHIGPGAFGLVYVEKEQNS